MYNAYEELLKRYVGLHNELSVYVADVGEVVGKVSKMDKGGCFIEAPVQNPIGMCSEKYIRFEDMRYVGTLEHKLE